MGVLPMLALTIAMLLWSSAFISLKYLLDFFHPTQIVFIRMLIASGCFFILRPETFTISLSGRRLALAGDHGNCGTLSLLFI